MREEAIDLASALMHDEWAGVDRVVTGEMPLELGMMRVARHVITPGARGIS
jgi:hypothetical protein